jgi:hypothetical protein
MYALVQPAVDSRPQTALDVVADSQDKEQFLPKNTQSEKLVLLASNHIDSVPVALADGILVQREHKRSLKKESCHKEPASSQLPVKNRF